MKPFWLNLSTKEEIKYKSMDEKIRIIRINFFIFKVYIITINIMNNKSFIPPSRTLMGPGPSDVSQRVLEAMARPTIGHLDPIFIQMMDDTKKLLQYAFQTKNELTFAVSAPGMAGMECCFANLVEENYKFFSDQKILGLLSFLQENLDRELSNKVISNHLNISEDYVGQFFKNSIGFSPQDYIEHIRMERAIELLREDENAVKVISNEVGYKDTAYFCRRFKLMFGVQAGKMRKRLGEI